MIVATEIIRALPGKEDELKRALLKLVPTSRQAAGCLQYDLLEPVDQSGEFLILMRWDNLAALRKHEASDYIAAFVKKEDKILYDEVKVTEWKEVR